MKTIRAVLWSFIGIRNSKEYQKDISSLKPINVIVTGIILAVFFVLSLLAIVKILIALFSG
tara:strand:- start:373 stop:555 length:183 start_codon:yes stop_codon:yes gene_type:complete